MTTFRSPYPIHHFTTESSAGGVSIPQEMWNVARPPHELYIEGSDAALELLSRLPTRGLAIVGSRHCQSRSLLEVKNALSALRGFNLIIVSGLARGIDTQAHACALNEGFPTIGVLGCGVNRSYPEENAGLRRRILDAGGLIISEFPPDADPKPDHFIRRNRLIAGWTQATWVVEAGYRSGAINTASWAKSHDRYCFVTPCYPGDATLVGNQRLLEGERLNQGRIRAFWNPRCLAEVWLDLESHLATSSTQASRSSKRLRKKPENEDRTDKSEALRKEIQRATLAEEGISLSDLLSWAQQQAILRETFFRALRALQESEQVVLQAGVLRTPPYNG